MNEKILVTRPLLPDFDEYAAEIKDIFDSKFLTNSGPKHQLLEKNLKEYMGVENISLFANGHLALEVAIKALDLHGEIITTPFTFASTTHAIVACGCTPIFCDVDPVTYTIDVNKIEALITAKTVAILPVHVYGTVCDLDKIASLAEKYNLKVIYDAAHCFGVKVNETGVGNFGDISMFSFHATKVFNTVEGGCLTYKDSSLKSKIERIRSFGTIPGSDNSEYVGTNAKMTEVSAAMGICNLRHIDQALADRKIPFDVYNSRLSGIDGVNLIAFQDSVLPNYAYYPVVFEEDKCGTNRDIICERLNEQNIFPRKYFSPLTSGFECYKNKYAPGDTPIAKFVAENVLVLPLYAGLSAEEANKICDIILNEVQK